MEDTNNYTILKIVVGCILALLIAFMLIAFPAKQLNTNETSVVSVR